MYQQHGTIRPLLLKTGQFAAFAIAIAVLANCLYSKNKSPLSILTKDQIMTTLHYGRMDFTKIFAIVEIAKQ
jgi:hypothetical protein